MPDDGDMRRRAAVLGSSLACAALVLLAADPAMAAKAVVIRSGADVHSAPFAVAPAIGHLDLDATLTADDQAKDGWRRVRLPSGVYGFVADDALRIEAPSSPAVTPAQPPAAAPPPDAIPARVKVLELTVRAAPDASAPVLSVLSTGTLLTVSPSATDGWRRTRLPDGRAAYVADAGLDFGPAPQAVSPAGGAPVQPLSAPPRATPHAKIYVTSLDHLSNLVASDKLVGDMVESLVTRRQAAIATFSVGVAGSLLLESLGLFVYTSQDCVGGGNGLGPPLCTKRFNTPLVWAGIGVLSVSAIVGLVLMPKRSDLLDVVNAWNPRHLDDQFTVETVTTSPASGALF